MKTINHSTGLLDFAKASICAQIFVAFLLSPLSFHNAQAKEPAQNSRAAPEAATGWQDRKIAKAQKFMIVAANPHASKAGYDMLKQGGSAVDAAIAAQLVLGLVEPQSSGLGGGAFLLFWDKTAQKMIHYDGREKAPLAADENMFLRQDGSPQNATPMPWPEAVFSGLSIGTPGVVDLMARAHKAHGKLAWAKLFEPALKLAEQGFAISPRLHGLLSKRRPSHFGPAAAKLYFDEQGQARPVGYILKNAEYAKTLQLLKAKGAAGFYQGELAQAIVARVANAPNHKGRLSLEDLKTYATKTREPLCVTYRAYKICGMGPPSSGALTVAQTLKLIEPFDLGAKPLNGPALHLLAEAQKLAFADRNRYISDPDFSSLPAGWARAMVDKAYLAKRRALIKPDAVIKKAEPGALPNMKKTELGKDYTQEKSGTSHISIIDGDGNAVSMTTTIESAFGARIMVGGFFLNNEMTDFSLRPKDESGQAIANRVEAGKRPRSSMAPTLVFDNKGELAMVLGSPGGSRIIGYVVKSLVAMIDWKLDPQAAAALPNFTSRNGPLEIEAGLSIGRAIEFLRQKGQKVVLVPMTSGSHIIMRKDGALWGGVDPRREGQALGD